MRSDTIPILAMLHGWELTQTAQLEFMHALPDGEDTGKGNLTKMHAEEIPYSSSHPPHPQEEIRGCQLMHEKSYLTILIDMGIDCWQPRKRYTT